ncbi:D-alanyl-D-alanine carboxypeptidase [Agrobacterium rubi]|nr:D-alanyl-D-alanine carboxypeptidase [Agrobacterium rubi]NTF24002.1 D-alanyl-D-alanine carboxypeptidase [Agrobacterium rubi]
MRAALFAALITFASASAAEASPRIIVDAMTGEVIFSEEANMSWHPASLTKLMTANLAFKAVRDGRISGGTPIVMTKHASSVAPSRLGIPPGTGVRLDDALSIMLTRSMNDIATAIAENLAANEEAFVAEMNREASLIGMKATRFTNASGLPDKAQVSTAEDLAILAIHILRTYPERRWMFGVPELSVAGKTLHNTNGLIGKFNGSDGMKTGYVCGSGFNVVSTATRNGRQIIAVVLGAPNPRLREQAAAAMLDYGFHHQGAGRVLLSTADRPSAANDMTKFACGRTNPSFRTSMPTSPPSAPVIVDTAPTDRPIVRRF